MQLLESLKKLPRPDVFLLQEVQGRCEAWRIATELDYPYVEYTNYDPQESYGIAILSRHELTNHRELRFNVNKNGQGALFAEVEIGGKTLLLGCVHFHHIEAITRHQGAYTPGVRELGKMLMKEVFQENDRSKSARELLEFLATQGRDQVILGGDFNTIPFSKAIRTLNHSLRDVLWPSADYLDSTYQRLDFPIRPRIDYIFHSAAVHREDAEVLKFTPGDHLPVLARFRL